MSTPIQAAVLHNKRLEEVRNEPSYGVPKSSILKWYHWKVNLPEEGKMVVISNEQNILLAKIGEPNKWKAGVNVLTFEEYPLWAEQPSFAKTAKKANQVSKDID